jgi:hypothetical protein
MIKRGGGNLHVDAAGLRLARVEAIVREEMNRAGAIERFMPVIQPAELWQESGRWDKYGPDLLRIKDRHQRDFSRATDIRKRSSPTSRGANSRAKAVAGQPVPHPDQVPRRGQAALRRDALA